MDDSNPKFDGKFCGANCRFFHAGRGLCFKYGIPLSLRYVEPKGENLSGTMEYTRCVDCAIEYGSGLNKPVPPPVES